MKSHDPAVTRLSRTTQVAFIGFASVALFYLVTEHRAHLLGALPFVLLLSCLVMHFFMHGKHGHEGHSEGTTTADGGDETPRSRPGAGEPLVPATVEETLK